MSKSNPSPAASIVAKDLTRMFPSTGLVIDHVNFSVAPGEFIALLGPSGCGKSTLLRMIAGLDAPDSGELTIDAAGATRFRGFVFQDSNLLPWLPVVRNVALPLELRGVGRAEAEEQAKIELKKVGLSDALDRYPLQLSGGMKMRVSLARAMVTGPTLLLLDEPFSALDERARFSLQEDLRRIWEQTNITIVFVTHSVSEAVFLAQRAIVLSNRPGRIVLDAPIDLPTHRESSLRLDSRLVREMKKIYDGVPISEARL